jgi:hypothetical protein
MMDYEQGCPAAGSTPACGAGSKEVPQPQALTALGLLILNPASLKESE